MDGNLWKEKTAMDKIEAVRAWALARVGNPYIMGGTGKQCTVEYRKARANQYPDSAENIKKNCQQMASGKYTGCDGCKWAEGGAGKQAYDCAQLVRFAMEEAGIHMVSGATSQWRKTEWALTGTLDTLPEGALCILYRQDAKDKMGHTGIYMGDGTAIHARGHAYGVVRNALYDSRWTHWGIPAGLYTDGTVERKTLKKGDAGEGVRALQEKLLAAGFLLPRYGADGQYGSETVAAVMSFQAQRGLEETGNADRETMDALMAAQGSEGEPGESDDVTQEETITITLRREEAETLLEALKSALGGV